MPIFLPRKPPAQLRMLQRNPQIETNSIRENIGPARGQAAIGSGRRRQFPGLQNRRTQFRTSTSISKFVAQSELALPRGFHQVRHFNMLR